MTFIPAEVFTPAEFIIDEMAARGMSVKELRERSGLSPEDTNRIFTGGVLTADDSAKLGKCFGTSKELFLNLERAFRPPQVGPVTVRTVKPSPESEQFQVMRNVSEGVHPTKEKGYIRHINCSACNGTGGDGHGEPCGCCMGTGWA